MLTEGTEAPDFTLPDHNGVPFSLGELRGTWLVLWWFPNAGSGG